MNTSKNHLFLPLLLCLCLLANGAIAEPSPAERSAQVDEVFAAMDNRNSPGCAVGVIQNGEFVHKAAYGMVSPS